MINVSEARKLKGYTVQIAYGNPGKPLRILRGTLKSVGMNNLCIERTSGSQYHIPLRTVARVVEISCKDGEL